MKLSKVSVLGITLVEMMMTSGVSSILMGGFLSASMALQRSFQAAGSFSHGHSTQMRLIDYVAQDLRRASKVSTYSVETRELTKFASPPPAGFMTVTETSYLVLTLPGFYASEDEASPLYGRVNPLISVGQGNGVVWGVTYGSDAANPAPESVVRYEQVSNADGTKSFIRGQGTAEQMAAGTAPAQVVADRAEDIYLNVTADTPKSFLIELWFEIQRGTGRVDIKSSDQVMIRNPRED
jgi:hypothetical protein